MLRAAREKDDIATVIVGEARLFKHWPSGDYIVMEKSAQSLYFSSSDLPRGVFYPMTIARKDVQGEYNVYFSVSTRDLGISPVDGSYEGNGVLHFGDVRYTELLFAREMSLRVLTPPYIRLVEYAFQLESGRCVLVTAPIHQFSYRLEFYMGFPGELAKIGTTDEWRITRYRDGGTTDMFHPERDISIRIMSRTAREKKSYFKENGKSDRIVKELGQCSLDEIARAFRIDNLEDFGVYDMNHVSFPVPTHREN